MSDVTVRVEHARKARMCARGMRGWFERYGLDFKDFLMNGIPASKLEALNDALANRVVDVARKEAK